MSSPLPYWLFVTAAAVVAVVLCVACRRWPGPWVRWAGRALALVLAADAVVFVVRQGLGGTWSVQSSLPLALCDVALVVAAVACWYPSWSLGVELTYFWGLAGTLQAVLTPDLHVGFPSIEFVLFVVGHLGIVLAALYLVVGLRIVPRPGAAVRVFGITVAYAAVIGAFNWLTGSNYMYLAAPPENPSLLSLLGPWPWYLLSATGVAIVLFAVLDAPFRHTRGRAPVDANAPGCTPTPMSG
ncbi:MAG TPA: TIGR02206 family membrane protein [Lapillicoccus sp.]|uniref:YwaF family protein n=1 Tax=Lapillicoccus sp. TaxID=1909287 RepID=UPI002F934681